MRSDNIVISGCFFVLTLCSQEVKAAAELAVKDQAAREKQVVSLEERRKHASSKAKKLKKTLQDVSHTVAFPILFPHNIQDESAHSEAQRTIKECASKIEKKQTEVEDREAELRKEEDVLEDIRDSLKGGCCLHLPLQPFNRK